MSMDVHDFNCHLDVNEDGQIELKITSSGPVHFDPIIWPRKSSLKLAKRIIAIQEKEETKNEL